MPEPQQLVARLAKQLDGITNPKARASVYWLVGQFAASDVPPKHGLGWDGVAVWVPDVLRKGVKGFVQKVRTGLHLAEPDLRMPPRLRVSTDPLYIPSRSHLIQP